MQLRSKFGIKTAYNVNFPPKAIATNTSLYFTERKYSLDQNYYFIFSHFHLKMQLLKAEHWVNATMEQHPQAGHGTPQQRSYVPFRERCKTSREECSSTILPALAVNKYDLRILLGAGKTQGGGKKTNCLFPGVLTGVKQSRSLTPQWFPGGTASRRGQRWARDTGQETPGAGPAGNGGILPACPGSGKWFLARFL